MATALALTPSLRGLWAPGAALVALTVATAAITAGAAILAEVAGRICDLPRWSWVAGALALYGVVVLPVTALANPGDTPRLLLVRVAAYLTALPLLLFSLRPPVRFGSVLPWVVTVGGAVLAMTALAVPEDAVPTRAIAIVLDVVEIGRASCRERV